MAAYLIVGTDVTDPERYGVYSKMAVPYIPQYGGRYLVRGGNPETVEGDWKPTRMVVLAFDTVEQARRWWYAPEYQAAREQRLGATAFFDAVIVEGV